MASFRFCLLSAVICSVLVVASGEAPTTPPTKLLDLKTLETTVLETTQTSETTTLSDTTTSATTPITTSTTPSTTSTTPKTTTSTTPSTTTSTTPSTTTSTTPSTTTSTTSKSTTSTTTTTTQAPPTPTPKPGPPDMGTWSHTEKNVTCIMVQFAAQLNVTYPMANVSTVGVQQVNVPSNAVASVVSGSCGAANQSLAISWPASADKNNTITILFVKNDTTKSYQLNSLNVTLMPSMFPNISNVDSIDLYHGVEWQTPLATSYRCAASTKLTLTTAEHANIAATLTLSQLQEEAFRTAAGTGFSAARDCAGGDIPDAVPIAVGCALGGMVVVVLIAYLVARRRSAARGYLSM